VATLYVSGKLVVQGPDPRAFAERHLDPELLPRLAAEPEPGFGDATLVGSDESGKGDFLGPLVVAAVRLTPEESRALQDGSVRDSKRVADDSASRLAAALRARFPVSVRRLDPPQYNRAYQEHGNLNALLADLHAEVLGELAVQDAVAVVDQFGPAALMERALDGSQLRLVQRPRAESVPAVAAASLVARAEFLAGLEELGQAFAVDLAKGAGEPADRAARAFVALHGPDQLGEVAKLHFKNAERVRSAR
jgi:ribonuclease HIII